jgi:signal transduction histidine kinase
MSLDHVKQNTTRRSIHFQLYAGSSALVVAFGIVLLFLPDPGWGVARATLLGLGMLLALLLSHHVFTTLMRSVALINAAFTAADIGQPDGMSEASVPAELLALVRSYNVMSETLAARQHELHDQTRRTALLTQLSIELRESLDPALLVSDILRAIVANTDAKSASIILTSSDGAIEVASTIWAGQVVTIAPERAQFLVKKGLAGWVLRHGRNIALGNAAKETRWVTFHDQEDTGSVMALPLTVHSVTLGVLTISHPAHEQFTSKDLLLLAGVAAQAAVALRAAQRHAEERRRQEQALLLFTMSQFLTAVRSPVDLAAEVLEKSSAVFEGYHAALYLADHTTGDLALFAARAGPLAIDDAATDHFSTPMAAVAERAWQTQKTITENLPLAAPAGAAVQPGTQAESSQPSAVYSGLVCVALPLLHNGAAIGAFVLVAKAHDTAVFPARVWSLLTIFTNVAAVAFANRQLVDQLRLRAELLDQQVAERTMQLQRSRDLLRIIFDYLPDGLVLMDANWCILSANDAWCRGVLSRRPQEAVGRQYSDLIQEVEHAIALTFERAPSTSAAGRVHCTTPDGHQRWYEIDRYAVAARGADGEQIIERWRDVTLQEALHRRLLLQEQLTSLGRLATSVVHEIGNPLQGMRSSLDLCLEDPSLTISAAEYLELATSELERIGQTLDRLRDLYRAPHLAWDLVDLNDFIVAVQQSIIRQMRAYQIDIDLCLTPDLPPVYAQPDALRQVLLNLMFNAQAAMPCGGTIHVSSAPDTERRMSYFCVIDTGVGISAQQLDHIFEPFQSQNLKPGLGLYLSHLIIQQHHGAIELTSTLAAGTSVKVCIPWSEASNDTRNRVDRR